MKMAEYICREAIIDDLEKEIEAGNVALDEDVWINKGLRIAIRDIKDSKSIDAQPVKRGHWIEIAGYGGWSNPYFKCSECETTESVTSNFCPNCGADMRGEDDA